MDTVIQFTPAQLILIAGAIITLSTACGVIVNLISNKSDKFEYNTEKGLYRVSNDNSTTSVRMFFGLPDSVITASEAVSWFASNPTEIVYELATPTSFSVTPTTIITKNGTNNIFADSGDIEVSFKQGVQEYIDAKIGQ